MPSPLRTIGIIGGMSWESTLSYYRRLNESAGTRYGGLHSAPCVLWSVDFDPIARTMHGEDWEPIRQTLVQTARALKAAGAELLIVATNTMHVFAEDIEDASGLPLCHIGRAAGDAARERGATTAGLLGTRFTMEKPFYKELLEQEYEMSVVTPDSPDLRDELNRIIFDELCRGDVRATSTEWIHELIEDLARRGAEVVFLACTELGLAVDPGRCSIPVLDTVELHVQAALDAAARNDAEDVAARDGPLNSGD